MFSSIPFILFLLPAIVLSSPISVPENGLAKRACSGVTVIFARGTTETAPTGTVVGPPLQSALKSALGSTTLEFDGVDYAASIQGAAQGGDPTGSQTMATDVSNALTACPSTKLVMSGYSQGAQLVHNAAKILGAATMAKVSSVVTFGDPDQSQAVTGISPSKVKIFCASGDTICTGGFTITSAHLSYGSNAPAAASFIVSAAGL